MRWARAVSVVVVLVAALMGGAQASAHAVALRLVFRPAGTAEQIVTSTRYAFIANALGPRSRGTLIDEATGRRTRVERPGCSYSGGPVTGSPWLVFNCASTQDGSAPAPELYSIATGVWQGVMPSPSIADPCGPSAPLDACGEWSAPAAAGRDWIEYSVYSNNPHDFPPSEFQNLATGNVRRDPTGGNTILDLNAPSLSQTLCSPLRVPRYYDSDTGFGPGTVVPDGKFAISLGTNQAGIPMLRLERCGTRLHRLLTTGLYSGIDPEWAANRTTVVWGRTRNELAGVFLPSLRQFTIKLPAAAIRPGCQASDFQTCISEIALTARHLYLIDAGHGRVWTSPSPSEPKRS
jgi:hypothetical protein